MIFPSETRGLIEHSQPKGIKLKMTEHRLESGLNWQEVSKQKGIQQMGTKQGLRFPWSTVTAKMCDTNFCTTEQYVGLCINLNVRK